MLNSVKSRIIQSCKKEDKSEAVLDILQCFNSEEYSDSVDEQSLTRMRDEGVGGEGGTYRCKTFSRKFAGHFLKVIF